MKILELKKIVNSLPDEYLNYDIVLSSDMNITEESTCRLDEEIVSLDIDEDTQKLLLFKSPIV